MSEDRMYVSSLADIAGETFRISEDDLELEHYGILRRSGRYPWGSGGNATTKPYPWTEGPGSGTVVGRSRNFYDHIKEMKKEGLTDKQIYEFFGWTSTEYRNIKRIALNEIRLADQAFAARLREKGMSHAAIGKRFNPPKNESVVRGILAANEKDKSDNLKAISEMIKGQIDKKGFIDVGTGVENYLGVPRNKLDTAIFGLRQEGYAFHNVQIPQLGTDRLTTIKVLAPPGTTYLDIKKNRHLITQLDQVGVFSDDGGRNFSTVLPPKSISSKRVAVKYREEGGDEADGVIWVRPGVDDLSIGANHYAQVRIAVDGTHYLKGMAVYRDDLPKGVDLVFNTNKSNTGNKLDAMKPMKEDPLNKGTIDPLNPFGSIIRQIGKRDERGRLTEVTSAMNLVNEEADWEKWSKSLSSQVLSKQKTTLAKDRLDAAYQKRKDDFDEIMALTNPAVKKRLLESFADDAAAASIHLKAAAMKDQKTHVLLPLKSMKPTEIYAPNYKDGETVVLIRYPHGGKFEIPELTVNNRNAEGKKLIGPDAAVAVGIHSDVAKRLSGADFDGDTVLVIPNSGKHRIANEDPLPQLKDFDAQRIYKVDPKEHKIKIDTQREMGEISNLITDMTIGGANNRELAQAVKHSMVVIDADKHNLNYKQSALDNNIKSLRAKYQNSTRGGASTLISRAKSPLYVDEIRIRKASEGDAKSRGPIDPDTGKLVYVPTGKLRRDGTPKQMRIAKLANPDLKSAHELVSDKVPGGYPIERIYADHSDRTRSLGDLARKETLSIPNQKYNNSAAKTYKAEVDRLNAALHEAISNRPLERQAQVFGNHLYQMRKDANPDATKEELKKIRSLAMAEGRARTDAKKASIEISDREWEAIQAGAISQKKLTDILDNADLTRIRELATPRSKVMMDAGKIARAQRLAANGATQAEIAEALGVSVTTLKRGLGG